MEDKVKRDFLLYSEKVSFGFISNGRGYARRQKKTEVCRANETYAIELEDITKRFGEVTASHEVCLSVKRGEILSILDESGGRKITLMNMILGIHYPDGGQIFVNGNEVIICSPRDSFTLGIGMIHQHFELMDVLTTTRNIILGLASKEILDIKGVTVRINELITRYGFDLDPGQKIYTMPVSQKQTVEIAELLYWGVDTLILDKPIAVLMPQGTDRPFTVLRSVRQTGHSVIIIIHKLREVLALSDHVSAPRKEQYIGTVQTSEATEGSLTEVMVGKEVGLNIDRSMPVNSQKHLEVSGVACVSKGGVKTLDRVSFIACSGEVLGAARIAGSGQKELLESIAGLMHVESGAITYYPPEGGKENLAGISAVATSKLGVKPSFVSEDWLGMGLVGSMGMTDNMTPRGYRKGHLFFVDRRTPETLAEHTIEELEVVTSGVPTPTRKLSGGNVQKVLVEREVSFNPKVPMMTYPVRGPDISSSHIIYHLLNEQKQQGVAVICVGEDLDVLLEPCDRILVLCGGRISDIMGDWTATKEEAGLMMTKAGGGLDE